MADATDWNNLRQRCADNGAKLCLRVETTDGMHLSLSAVEAKFPNRVVADIRATLGDHAPQFVVTEAVSTALKQWWPE